MRAALALAAAAAALALCLPANAQITVYTATLSGPAESPINDSPGTGLATVTVDPVAMTMRVEASFSGLTGTTTASHIHCCTAVPGVSTAGVATTTPNFAGFPLGVTSGTFDSTLLLTQASTFNPDFVTASGGLGNAASLLLAGLNEGTAYFNIHTSTFGGGEIRGFLVQVVAIPEPGTYLLLLAGLGVVGMVARRRRHG